MRAAERLFLTAERDALVGEGDPAGAFLYAAPGDEIPESAAEMFGLVDGRLPGRLAGILRVAARAGTIEAAGLSFAADYREFRPGDIDEAQLLEILKQPDLIVEGALVGDPSSGWVPFPGRDQAIVTLQERVDQDIANGRAHERLSEREPDAADNPAAAGSNPPAKEGDAGENKEAAPGKDKEAKPGKGAGNKAGGS